MLTHSNIGLFIANVGIVAVCLGIAYVAIFGNPFRRSVTKE